MGCMMNDFESFENGIRIYTQKGQFPVGTDSILLSSFVRLRANARVLDLGCGAGTLGLLLCGRNSTCRALGIELQEQACLLAQRNAAYNGLEERMQILQGDLRQYRDLIAPGSYTAVVCNPPYFPVGSGKAAQGSLRQARMEQSCTLPELCCCAAWSLQFGGAFFLVHRPERLADLIYWLRQSQLEPKRIQFVRHRASAGVSLVLLESRLGGRPGLTYETDLVLFHPDGSPTAQYRDIYHI